MKYKNNQRGFAHLILIAVAVVVLGGGGTTVAASNSAKPGDVLYPIDQAVEKVQLAMAFGDENKANMHKVLAHERFGEVKSLINGNAPADKIDNAVRNYGDELEDAQKYGEKLSDAQKENVLGAFSEQTILEQDELQGLANGAGDQIKAQIQEAVNIAQQTQEKAMNQLSVQKQEQIMNQVKTQLKNIGDSIQNQVQQNTGSDNGQNGDENSQKPDEAGSGNQPAETSSDGSNSSSDNGSGSGNN